jgi:hypothetical protein
MSHNIISIGKLLKEVISEVGDLNNIKPLPYDLKKGTFVVPYNGKDYEGKVVFTFLNEKGLSIFEFPPVVGMLNIKTGYNVGYSIEGVSSQLIRADVKLLLAILKAVSIIVADHIAKHPDSIYLFFAESKTGVGMEDPQKLTLYQQILGKNLPQGFRIGKTNILQDIPGLFICKIN